MKRGLASIIVFLSTLTGTVAGTAGPAHAVLPICGAFSYVWASAHGGTHNWKVEYHRTSWSSTTDYNCEFRPSSTYYPYVEGFQSNINVCYGPEAWRYNGYTLLSQDLVVDGYYGSKTTAAVKAIQAFHGQQQDGWAGPKTRSNMKAPFRGAGGVRCWFPDKPITTYDGPPIA